MKVLLAAAILLSGSAAAQTSGPLFEKPFLVERTIEETAGGDTYTSTSKEYWGGSWLVAVRQGEDRTVIDFARREIQEISVTKGTYWTLSFSRMRELRERLHRAENEDVARPSARPADAPVPRILVEELAPQSARSARPGSPARLPQAIRSDRPGEPAGPTRRGFRARVDSASGATLEAWVDDSVVLGAGALDALAVFEKEELGPVDGRGEPGPADLADAVRRKAGGALSVLVKRETGASAAFRVEDRVTRITPLAMFPARLVTIPEGLRRVASPLEVMVSYAEEEAALKRRGR
ncbi:MAG: hypothetical protein JNK60_04600 [Acidobacteria bacterium]|nr:hypothetical protein [Acidobacteriota bacterium]